jgi:hypothetical protein
MDRMSNGAALRAGSSLLALVIGGCFGDAPPPEQGTTTEPTTSSSSTNPTTTDTDSALGTTTSTTSETTADTTVDPTLADSSTSTSSESSSSSSGTDTGEVVPDFFDDFDRADSQAIGNGWVEKLPSVFSINENMVVAGGNRPQQYFDQVVYQNDVVDDIELRVEFRIDVANDLNEPHLVARQQEAALVSGSFNHCYILVPQLSQDRLCLMRFDSAGFIGEDRCTDWPDSDLVVGDWYRLVMTIDGPGPVELTGRLEHADGDAWTEVVAVEWVDKSPNQIAAPGVWGFSGGTTGAFYNNFVFDNFSAYYQ